MAFKMKGSPMKRNFGVGNSPVKQKLGVDPIPNEPPIILGNVETQKADIAEIDAAEEKYGNMGHKELKKLLIDETYDRGQGMTSTEWTIANRLLNERLEELSIDELTGKVGIAETPVTPAPQAGEQE